MNYNNKKFRAIFNSNNGEVSSELIFHYLQTGSILTCEYQGKQILKGHLIGLVDENGIIEMSYHQVNKNGELMTGICTSKPEILANGKVRLLEEWQWTSGDKSKGNSILEEL
ncbi:MAG: n-acetylglutamate synthase [Flavobacteriaceae bacterium]